MLMLSQNGMKPMMPGCLQIISLKMFSLWPPMKNQADPALCFLLGLAVEMFLSKVDLHTSSHRRKPDSTNSVLS